MLTDSVMVTLCDIQKGISLNSAPIFIITDNSSISCDSCTGSCSGDCMGSCKWECSGIHFDDSDDD